MTAYDRAMTLLLSDPDVCNEICKLVQANVRNKTAPRPMGITRKMRDLYEFIKDYAAANEGVPPSFDEMRVELDLASKSGIHRLITALEDRGLIRRLPNRARSIVCIDQELVRGEDA